MKRIILGLIAVMVLSVPAYAAEEKIAVITKQGNIYHWKTMYEKDGAVCTRKSYGEMCIPKSEIKEIAKSGKGASDKIVEEKRVDVGRVEVQSTSFSDTTSQAKKEEAKSGNSIPYREFKLVRPDWSWMKDDGKALQEFRQAEQRRQSENQRLKNELNNKAQSMGLGTVK